MKESVHREPFHNLPLITQCPAIQALDLDGSRRNHLILGCDRLAFLVGYAPSIRASYDISESGGEFHPSLPYNLVVFDEVYRCLRCDECNPRNLVIFKKTVLDFHNVLGANS